jgi:hypothetical protein
MVQLVDFAEGTRKTFKADLKGQDDPRLSYLVSGLADAMARDKLSLAECAYAASQVGKGTAPPTYLDAVSSYAVIKASPRYEAQLRRVLGNPVKEMGLEKKNLKLEQLLEELTAKEALYRPSP